MDKYRIDGHKLALHPKRVADWLEGKDISPLYMELSPAGSCNHRCVFCGLDFMGYQKRFLSWEVLARLAGELSSCGLKSAMFAGEGEPLLHKDIAKAVALFAEKGIDSSLTTNAVLLGADKAEGLLRACKWIKVSINGGSPEVYARMHGCAESDFVRVISNMEAAAELKRKLKLSCTLGMQIILLPDNACDVEKLARIAKGIGMDYLVVKPYSQHIQSATRVYEDISYQDCNALAERLKAFDGDGFSLIFRSETMKAWDERKKNYDRCLALPFWSYIDAGGNVWGCSVFLNDKRFLYGNVNESSFADIWHGEQRRKSLEFIENEFDCLHCRVNCRMDKINEYLHELKNPQEHVNFI